MVSVCQKLEVVVEVIDQFKRFLGPRLRAVTRSHRALDDLSAKAEVMRRGSLFLIILLDAEGHYMSVSCSSGFVFQALASTFDHLSTRLFDEGSGDDVSSAFQTFWKRTHLLEDDCIRFLDTHFTKLRSAVSAFNMLKDFSTNTSRPKINAKLGEKFVEILKQFSTSNCQRPINGEVTAF